MENQGGKSRWKIKVENQGGKLRWKIIDLAINLIVRPNLPVNFLSLFVATLNR